MTTKTIAAITAALLVTACGQPPKPYVNPYVAKAQSNRDAIAHHIASTDCPNAGEVAAARPGQLAGANTHRTLQAVTRGDKIAEGLRQDYLIATKVTRTNGGSFVGMNGFGATRTVAQRADHFAGSLVEVPGSLIDRAIP
jgi:hypothetical protein